MMETGKPESRFVEKKIIAKKINDLAIERSCKFYNSSVESLVRLYPDEDVCKRGYNQHLLVPLDTNQTVYRHPVQIGVPNGFIRTIQQIEDGRYIEAIFQKSYFSEKSITVEV